MSLSIKKCHKEKYSVQTLTGTVPLCNVKLGSYKGMLNALCSPYVTDVTFPANPIMSLFPKERGKDMRAGERTGLLDLLICEHNSK